MAKTMQGRLTVTEGRGYPLVLINAATLAPGVANWPPKFDGILFSALRSVKGHKVKHLLVLWGRLKSFFFSFSLDSYCKALRLISTFAPIGMLDLG